MPRFKVTRIKKYVIMVDAFTAVEAVRLAEEAPGKDWELIEDTANDVVGMDGARQRVIDSGDRS